jgi:hypothetical protein
VQEVDGEPGAYECEQEGHGEGEGEVLKFESAKVLKLGEFGEVLKFESAKVLKLGSLEKC